MYNKRTLRVLFFGIGLIAVVTLTGMNVYSLYELRESSIEAAKDHKKNQIEEFTSQVRYRFFRPFRGIRKLDIEYLQEHYIRHGDFPDNFKEVLVQASQDSIFGDIYFSPASIDHCLDSSEPIYKFDPEAFRFERLDRVGELVCDGMGLARSRMKVLIDDYRWNNKATFDTHRSMTLSMINLTEREVIGHLTFLIDRDYLVNDYFAGNLLEKFGPANETGIVVWLIDFMQEEILAGSDPEYLYGRDLQIDIRQRFPDLLDNWVIHAQIADSPTVAASNASLTRNLIVLGSAVFALFGAFIFMYITAKRERELAQRQSGFLANVTHELKTPLAAMQAAGENLSDGRVVDSGRIRTYGEHIYNETIRLRKMIEKLLDIARIDSGHSMMVQPVASDAGELLHHTWSTHQNLLRTHGFDCKLEIEPDLPPVLVDPDHLETILGNLIDNAIKYSFDKKELKLKVFRSQDGVTFLISDKGIGIPRKAQKRIFEKFYRVEDSMTAKTRGHGLGLSIVDNLVKLNDGKIRIESRAGEGSRFMITFPIARIEKSPAESVEAFPTPSMEKMKKPGYATESS